MDHFQKLTKSLSFFYPENTRSRSMSHFGVSMVPLPSHNESIGFVFGAEIALIQTPPLNQVLRTRSNLNTTKLIISNKPSLHPF